MERNSVLPAAVNNLSFERSVVLQQIQAEFQCLASYYSELSFVNRQVHLDDRPHCHTAGLQI